MSGFIAIVNTNGAPVDRGLLESLTASLHFKGPDQQKVWIDGSVGLGHALFRTTDEAQYENQPASLDGKVWITGSIRIDARKELVNRLGLTSKIQLERTPDSELVLHAYRMWGEKCLEQLLGDFAFAIWDGDKRQLFCAKDRFGMRQLYYSQVNNSLIVSNSMHTMLSHPEISKNLNDKAIGGFLLFGDHNWLDKSISAFADVNLLLPARSLTLSNEKLIFQHYWDLPVDTPLLKYKNERDYIEHFQEVFETAVADRIRTSKIVVSMSGGMDSSSVAAIAQKVIRQKYQSPEINAATVIYEKMYSCEERYYSSLVASMLGLPIHYTSGDSFPFLSQSFQATRPMEVDQPSLWLDFQRSLSKLGRVILTGDSADNLFHYPSTSVALKESNMVSIMVDVIKSKQRYGVMPGLGTGLRGKLKALSEKNKASYCAPFPFPSWLNPDFKEKAHLQEYWDEMWESLNKPTYQQTRYLLLKKSLLKPNWTSEDDVMHSNFTLSEQLDPYLDLRMVEFVLSLPALPWLFKKDILRRSMQGKLPSQVISRPKTPLGIIRQSIWRRTNSRWIDEWQSHTELHQYVERTKIPSLTGENYDPLAAYINLRPLLLNSWL